jgi:hypothetical protein
MHVITKVALILSLALLVLASGCSQRNGIENDATFENGGADAAKGAPSPYGNCLSTPVIFAEGHGLTGTNVSLSTGLRGMAGVESFISPYDNVTFIDGYPVYQNPSVNEWQADWADGSSWSNGVPVELDWSDNLTRQTWTDRSKVRVEVVLTTPLDPNVMPLRGYNMYSLGGTQLNEVMVTNTTRFTATSATVYSNVARLKIEKLDVPGGVPVNIIYDSPCYEGYFIDGPSNAYSAEVNMGGKCIYGFNWDIAASSLTNKTGWYRLTFSLDATAFYTDTTGAVHNYTRNTVIASLNPGDLLGSSDPEIVLYPPTLSSSGHASVLEVYVKAKGSGRK